MQNQLQEFAGRRVVVTGATRGIGAAIAAHLASAGASVTVTGRGTAELAPGIRLVPVDSSTVAGAAELFAAIQDDGPIDVLINTVGGSASRGGILDLTDEDWSAAVQANLLSAVRVDRQFVPGMVARRSGVIVHVTSIQRRLPMPWSLPYAAAKAALTNYSKGLATELAPHGVRVVAVAPGLVETPAVLDRISRRAAAEQLDESEAREAVAADLGGIPLGHLGQPQDIAHLVAFLVSDRAQWITGVEYVADGGTVRTL
ncbi:MAG: yvrD1 [Glaciihabitans sp.]|jgi:NAD(P)-dependent dehydrogenase (short-subunit alcohol dehydrogenase family)|nr:yvrD1 [Glaciihabitans sp.]